MYQIKLPKKISNKQIREFFKKKKLDSVLNNKIGEATKVNKMLYSLPYKPDLNDLYRLYQFIILNKRTTVLEFGTGWSSLIFASALKELRNKFEKKIKLLRRNNPFELFIVDNEKKFFNISKKRVKKFINKKNMKKVHFTFSDVQMTNYNGNIASEYKKIPLCNPDFIYLDGPDQFGVKKDINGISTKHKDMMPMSCDILKIEYFLTPGTIIVCDGRGANSKFLKDNLKRNWIYKNDLTNDQHIFYLNDPLLGKYNKLQIKFYKNK